MKKLRIIKVMSFALIGGGTLVGIPLAIDSCACARKHKPAEPVVEIGDEITEEKAQPFLVPSAGATQTTVYTNATNLIVLDHKLLDLKSFYESETANPQHQSLFTIMSNIDFGFLIDPDMTEVRINAINGAMITCASTTNIAAGIVIGRTSDSGNWEFKGKLTIDNNVNFNISSQDGNAYGVYFFPPNQDSTEPPTTNSEIHLNGTFLISSISGSSYGIWFGSPTRQRSELETDGTFIIQAGSESGGGDCCGIYISGYGYGQGGRNRTKSYGNFVIKGCWFVHSINDESRGVYFTVTDNSVSVNFSGIFNVFGKKDSSCYGGDKNNLAPIGNRREELESNSTFFVTSSDGPANFLDCGNILGQEKFGDFGGIWAQSTDVTKCCRVLNYRVIAGNGTDNGGGSDMRNVSFNIENLYVLKNNSTHEDYSASSYYQSVAVPPSNSWYGRFSTTLTDKMQCISNKDDWWTEGVVHITGSGPTEIQQSYESSEEYRTWTTKEDLPNPTIITIPTLENAPQWKIGYYDCDGNSGDTKQHMKSALQDYWSSEACPTLAKGWISSALQQM